MSQQNRSDSLGEADKIITRTYSGELGLDKHQRNYINEIQYWCDISVILLTGIHRKQVISQDQVN